jgi:hypothetical protein
MRDVPDVGEAPPTHQNPALHVHANLLLTSHAHVMCAPNTVPTYVNVEI